ncbi:MAG: UDP-N-acetylmuramoyl-tripeptide--D-alanyl-D-alanine ligase [Fimbriimonadaceae bacterium]
MNLSVEEFSMIVGGQPSGFAPGAALTGFATDHREIKPGDFFIAIKGARVDGHDFVEEAVKAAAAGAIVERTVASPHVLVPNLVEGLAKLGRHFRSKFEGPVIGITGSAGKTTTKEFTAAALTSLGPVIKSEGNKNTEYTSPLVWPLAISPPATNDVPAESSPVGAVIEMAMRGAGQIKHLSEIHRPTIGLITNIGYAHLEKVGSRGGIADAKAELIDALPADGTAILWQEDPFLEQLRVRAGERRIFTFGASQEADCRIEHYRALSWTESWIKGRCLGTSFEAKLPTVGKHQALNAAAGLLAAVEAGADVTKAAALLKDATIPEMRMQVINANMAMIMLDTYNASPPSMIAAIETLAELPCMGRKMAIIGEMKELGDYTIEAHREVGRALVKANLHKILFYGMPTTFARQELVRAGAPQNRLLMATELKDVQEFLQVEVQPGDAVLIKGSRALELEKALDGMKVGA